MRKILLLLFVCGCIAASAYADTLRLKSGETVEGNIIERNNEFVRMTVNGRDELFLSPEIASINGAKFSSPVVTDYEQLSKVSAALEKQKSRGSVSVVGSPQQEQGDASTGFERQVQMAMAQLSENLPASVNGSQNPRSHSSLSASQATVAEKIMASGFFLFALLLGFLLGYVYPSYCLMRIARKAGAGSAWMAWVPVANLFLMCKIGGLSYLWLLGYLLVFIPLVGVFAIIGLTVYIWYNIALACNKPGWFGFLVIVPLGYFIIIGVLAFTTSDTKERRMIHKSTGTDAQIKIERCSETELQHRGVFSWPVWEKEVSRFDWHYDKTEQCYILEGEAVVEYANERKLMFGKGDFVTFPKGLSCVWDIKKPVRKHYNFS